MPSLNNLYRALLAVDHFTATDKKYCIYGAGRFTSSLLELLKQCDTGLPEFILDDKTTTPHLSGIPVHDLSWVNSQNINEVLLGTDTFQSAMKQKLQGLAPGIKPVDLDDLHTRPDINLPEPCETVTNLFHCCGHKTASQWLMNILSDNRTRKYSSLTPFNYEKIMFDGFDPRKISERTFSKPFPVNTVISPMFISYDGFKTIPKPPSYRAFYVIRDPRDMIVSLFFSMKYSHPPMGAIPQLRNRLNAMCEHEGIMMMIKQWHDTGYFKCIRSWIDRSQNDDSVTLVRYEDLTGNAQVLFFRKLFNHCRIPMPSDTLCDLLADHSFEAIANRKKGEEDIHSHLRKGISGDWKNHFDNESICLLNSYTGNLINTMGYEYCPEHADKIAQET